MRRLLRGTLAAPLLLATVVALFLGIAGTATAGHLITGAQIKNNSVSGKDIKNGSLTLKDIKKSEIKKLRGRNGADGANGTDGQSAFAPLPSGTSVIGGGLLDSEVSGGSVNLRNYSPLSFTPSAPLVDHYGGNPDANVDLGDPGTSADSGFANTTACTGDFDTPTAAAGHLCVYLQNTDILNVSDGTIEVFAGSNFDPDSADDAGIYLYAGSAGAGEMRVRYVWVYTAP